MLVHFTVRFGYVGSVYESWDGLKLGSDSHFLLSWFAPITGLVHAPFPHPVR
jgi:hypothetical protein